MTAILGISAYYHDSAAALVVDGNIVAAAQEERFSRKKHDHRFPKHAVEYCLDHAGIRAEDIDYVGFYDKPLLKFDRLLETYLAYAPQGFPSFAKAMPLWLKEKLHLPREIRKGLDGRYKKRIVFCEHHESHAASAFYPSPFEEAVILTLDGVGEWATTTVSVGRGKKLELIKEIRFPHSLGLLYSAFTYFTGFKVNSGEYKLMGLAPYGDPTYVDTILEHLIDLKDDGSFRLDMSYFNYCQGLTMTNDRFAALFGGPPRRPESKLTQREMDLAASVQKVVEMAMIRIARFAREETGIPNLCLAGGVALNCVGNGKILREKVFDDVWIQPAAGDAGGALGVALLTWHQLLDNDRTPVPEDSQHGSYLGPSYSDDEVQTFLDGIGATSRRHADDDALCTDVAQLIADENVIGWFQGRMEYGPRALGGRSILADPRSPEMQSTVNLKIKFRESFRPFAPSVLADAASEFFDFPDDEISPYMLLVAPVADSKLLAEAKESTAQGLDRLKIPRSEIPAITHVDGSARLQTVSADKNALYHLLLSKFREQTGCPMLINTSFNVRGEPIVRTPEEAYRCFMATNMDVLVLGHHVLEKRLQPNAEQHDPTTYLQQFALD